MIKAIIFDCFGVLTTDGWIPYKQKYFGNDPTLFARASVLNRNVDSGLISYQNFIDEVSILAGLSSSDAKREIENNISNTSLFDYISTELKPRFSLGLLSNAAENWLDELFLPDQVSLFEQIALSYETGITKPDAGAYRIIADRLGVMPRECLFIDDQLRYCEGANDIGMYAIQYVNLEQLKTALADYIQA